MRLYTEAVDARKAGDQLKFVRKYKALMETDLFRGSQPHFQVTLNEELQSYCDEIFERFARLARDIQKSNEQVRQQFEDFIADDGQETDFGRRIRQICSQQERATGDALGWNPNERAWINFVRIGAGAVPHLRTIGTIVSLAKMVVK